MTIEQADQTIRLGSWEVNDQTIAVTLAGMHLPQDETARATCENHILQGRGKTLLDCYVSGLEQTDGAIAEEQSVTIACKGTSRYLNRCRLSLREQTR